jgi:glycine/D-amino acid oxidase-like deaminating enzyme
MQPKASVVVVGAGIMGASAYHLAVRGITDMRFAEGKPSPVSELL